MADIEQRARFEAWAESEGLIGVSHGIMSVNSQTETAWRAWQAALASQGEQHGALPIGDDGQPMVLVSQEFKSQADHDAETASAVANLLRNNSLGLSGSQPEMVAALLDLAARQPAGQEVPSVAATCDQYVIGDFGEPRKCAFKRAAGDTLCKRHRAAAEKTGYCPGKAATPPSQPQAPAAAVPEPMTVPYGSASGEKDYCYGYEKGRADGWNACRAALLASAPAPGVSNG